MVLIQPVQRARGQPTALLHGNAEIFVHIWKRLICTGNFSNIFSSIMIWKLQSNPFFPLLFYLSSGLPLHFYSYLKWASHACYEVNQNTLKSARVSTNNTNCPINTEVLVILPHQVNQIRNQAKPSPFNSAELLPLGWRQPSIYESLARVTVFNTTLIKPAPSKFNQCSEQNGFWKQEAVSISVCSLTVKSAAKTFC